METAEEFLKREMIQRFVQRELNHGLTVYLIRNERTGNTLLTSQPALFGGNYEKESIGIICSEGGDMGDDTFSQPIEKIINL